MESRPRDVASQIENYQARKGSFSLTMLLPRDDQSSSSIQEFPRWTYHRFLLSLNNVHIMQDNGIEWHRIEIDLFYYDK